MSDIANTVWPAAFTLADAVVAVCHADAYAPLLRGRCVLELGAGTGVAAMLAAQLANPRVEGETACPSACQPPHWVLTDSDSAAVERMETGIARNSGEGVRGAAWRLRTERLDWTEVAAAVASCTKRGAVPDAVAQLRSLADVVVGSDLVYEPSIVPPLCVTLHALLAPDGSAGAPSASAGASSRAHAAPPSETVTVAAGGAGVGAEAAGGDIAAAAALQRAVSSQCRAAMLTTTRRNPATYALLQRTLQHHDLQYTDVTDVVTALIAADGGPAVESLADLGLLPEAGAPRPVAWDVRIGLIVSRRSCAGSVDA
jgi:predicted nicotinamide N-methyase